MNIFYLNESPEISAIEHNDKHCVKMILESAQMLCTAHHHYAESYSQTVEPRFPPEFVSHNKFMLGIGPNFTRRIRS